ncbi:hypothetical protein T439DRAFT_320339 [Meredithblackwellia eburnea MCA 4105]
MGALFGGTDTKVSESEVNRKITMELVAQKEANERLKEELRVAQGGRSAALQRARELEDVLRLKEQMFDDFDRQLSSSQDRTRELTEQVSALDRQLAAIRLEQESFPISDMDLLHRHERQSALFESIQDALTCPVCYEFFGRNSAVSLLCGHSFCQPCFSSWEEKHLASFKLSSQQGAYTGADCPECRSTEVRRGKVRIWALEEAIRLVERGVRESKKPYTPPSPPESSTANEHSSEASAAAANAMGDTTSER